MKPKHSEHSEHNELSVQSEQMDAGARLDVTNHIQNPKKSRSFPLKDNFKTTSFHAL